MIIKEKRMDKKLKHFNPMSNFVRNIVSVVLKPIHLSHRSGLIMIGVLVGLIH